MLFPNSATSSLASLKSMYNQFMNIGRRNTERVEQKERTRQKLLSAARTLVEEGKALTVARAAERADVGEATAYRYYKNPRSLLRDALSIDWSGLDNLIESLGTVPKVADRAQRAGEELARFVLAHEASIRVLFATTNQEPRDLKSATGLPKASFRRRLVEAILSDTEELLGSELKAVQLALIVVISPYAVLTLRDAMLLKPAEIPAEMGRMARRVLSPWDNLP
jgi:AcrR family transcriptional regulator